MKGTGRVDRSGRKVRRNRAFGKSLQRPGKRFTGTATAMAADLCRGKKSEVTASIISSKKDLGQ